jgi:hypothetical protein
MLINIDDSQKYFKKIIKKFFKQGLACQTSIKACSLNPCLNSGKCIDIISNSTIGDFVCDCKNNYYGDFCEKSVNQCENSTCTLNQGLCFVNSSTNNASCKCFQYYSGENCEIYSNYMVYRKVIISIASVLAIIIISSFIILILSNDFFKYFLMKTKVLIETKKKIIKRFRYKPFDEKNDASNQQSPVEDT